MDNIIDISRFIGIEYESKGRSFQGADCWGLVCLVYKETFNIILPSLIHAYEDASIGASVREAIFYGKTLIEYTQKDIPEYGDLVIFNIRGNPCHVGIYIGNQKVLHVLKGTNSVCERLSSFRLKGRVEGYYEIRK